MSLPNCDLSLLGIQARMPGTEVSHIRYSIWHDKQDFAPDAVLCTQPQPSLVPENRWDVESIPGCLCIAAESCLACTINAVPDHVSDL